MDSRKQDFYFLFDFFDNEYSVFVKAIKKIGKSKLKPSEIHSIITDIRFCYCFEFHKKENFSKIGEAIDNIMDTEIDKLKQFKNKQKNLFYESEEVGLF
jgi:hypothetical protein